MAVSWLWLVALHFMSLLFPQVSLGNTGSGFVSVEYSSSDQNLLSPNKLSLFKRQTYNFAPCLNYYCLSGYSYATPSGPVCCLNGNSCPGVDNVSFTAFSSFHDLCLASRLSKKILIPDSLIHEQPCYPSCPESSCTIDTNCYPSCISDAATTSSDPYSAATTTSDPYPPDSAATTSSESSYETPHHHSSSSSKEKVKKLPPKAISGIVIGVVAFFTALGGACAWLWRRRKRRSAASAPSSAPTDTPEAHHPSPEYFKQPEAQVSPVSDSSPTWAPQRY